ncbi:MAG: amidohydrolase family protein [Acidimicrobiia bacterium]
MGKVSDIGLISADSHVNEPRDLWAKNLPASMRDQAMKGIEHKGDGGWDLILDGKPIAQTSMSEEERMAGMFPEKRFEVMRAEGIVGECVFPSIGLYVWMLTDPEGGKISCRIYNDWVNDTLESKSRRFRCAGLVPTWNVDDALVEIEHIASSGLAAFMIPAVTDPTYNHRQWEPMWHAMEETGLPVVVHQGTGHSMIFYRGPGASVSNLLTTQSMAPRMTTLLATSGVLERHPNLHFVFVEYNAGWMGWAMDTMDFYTESFSRYQLEKGGSWIYPELPEPPGFYVKRQVHATFQKDWIGIRNLPVTGADSIMWGSDYPHEEGTYPHSRAVVDELAADLDASTANRVFRSAAADIFKFDQSVLTTPV